jgi:transposase InsO family protein
LPKDERREREREKRGYDRETVREAGYEPSNYYKGRTERRRREADSRLVERLVLAQRAVQPMLGGGKLFHILKPALAEAGVRIGRDRFFEVLREKGLLLERLPGAPKTTNSRHSLPVFRNMVKDMTLMAPNQAWAADITYIRTGKGFLYLSLLTGLWSRKIVGFNARDTLEAEGAVRALEMALKELSAEAFPVHHSDRRCQYCSHRYVETLAGRGLPVSMTEDMHCYENVRAERLNGILKQEYGLGGSFRDKGQALAAIKEAVFLYNTKRPHLVLNYETPDKTHRRGAA